jgi:hypothetical protein
MVLGSYCEAINGTWEIPGNKKWFYGDISKQYMVLGRCPETIYGTREMP